MSNVLVVTGLSGGGRSEFAKDLDDLGWYVMDRVPAALLVKMADLAGAPGTPWERVAFTLRPDGQQGETLQAIEELRHTVNGLQVVFLDCSTEVLVNRYENPRRPHPFGIDSGLEGAIDAERNSLEPVRSISDLVIDTSELNVHQLREKVDGLYGQAHDRPMRIAVTSFGFKHGAPRDADMVLDCRFLPNPHWEEDLRNLSGLDAPVQNFVVSQELTEPFLNHLYGMLGVLLPAYIAEGRSFLSLAFGCTGGHHRSVAITETVVGHLRDQGFDPLVTHRDINR